MQAFDSLDLQSIEQFFSYASIIAYKLISLTLDVFADAESNKDWNSYNLREWNPEVHILNLEIHILDA